MRGRKKGKKGERKKEARGLDQGQGHDQDRLLEEGGGPGHPEGGQEIEGGPGRREGGPGHLEEGLDHPEGGPETEEGPETGDTGGSTSLSLTYVGHSQCSPSRSRSRSPRNKRRREDTDRSRSPPAKRAKAEERKNSRVFFDITIGGKDAGRIKFEVRIDVPFSHAILHGSYLMMSYHVQLRISERYARVKKVHVTCVYCA